MIIHSFQLFGKPAQHKEMTVKTMQNLNKSFSVALQSSFRALILDTIPMLRIFPNKIYDACLLFHQINDDFWNKQITDHCVSLPMVTVWVSHITLT